jgi:integrase
MRYLNHTESTTGQYRHAWTDIRRYFYRKGFHHYDEPLLKRFICEIRMLRNNSTMQEWKWKINRKAAYVLIETMNTGKFQWGIIKEDKDCISIEIEPIRNRYLEALKHRNLSKATIYLHDYVFRKLISFLGIKTANNLFTLSQRNVQRVIIYFAGICNRRSMSTILPILRSILLSLHTSGFIDKNLSGIVMSGFVQKGSVACYISKKDQTLLLKQIERESKRTKAIILLLLKLGLRESDIINLTFQEIDWRNDKIRLVQKKTGTPLVLPLLTDVGNALMDYILYERPKRDDRYPYIFLRKQAPYRKLTTLYPTCSKLLKKLEIKPVNGKAAGSRIFRYTTVYRLLAAKTPHQIITGTLGHVSRESDKPYISMEESMLRLCALDLSAIGRVSLKGDC